MTDFHKNMLKQVINNKHKHILLYILNKRSLLRKLKRPELMRIPGFPEQQSVPEEFKGILKRNNFFDSKFQ